MDGFTAYVIILLQVYNYVKMLYLNAALLLILLVIIGLMGGGYRVELGIYRC